MTKEVVDREQLEGFFGPESMAWLINRETTTLLAGGRALLLQLAHPLVAAGVAAHSSFRQVPAQRLQRTVALTQTIIFGARQQAMDAAGEVRAAHARVRGTLEASLGPFPAGTPYRASDPDLAGWVLATLVDSALLGYKVLVGRLPPDAEPRFWDEAKVFCWASPLPDFPPMFRTSTSGSRRSSARKSLSPLWGASLPMPFCTQRNPWSPAGSRQW